MFGTAGTRPPHGHEKRFNATTPAHGLPPTIRFAILWTSVATGKTMEKHGITNWTYVDEEAREEVERLRAVSGIDRPPPRYGRSWVRRGFQ